jgi:type I restriction enzyme M protein
VIADQLAKGRSQADAEARAESPAFYDTFYVPERARWEEIRDHLHRQIGDGLNKALQDLEHQNHSLDGVLQHIDFNRRVGQSSMSDKKLRELIVHFNRVPLRKKDFEFPDLLGAAYEYLIRDFADSAGKKGGEFYTPRDIVRFMVRIADPHSGMSVYDPCSGSGGMLILSKEYVEESGSNARDLALAGQEKDGSVWAISKMNMLLHGIPDADLRNNDDGVLEDPAHIVGGELQRFDRVITNPPFSMNYSRADLRFPERFRYGYTPEKGKKADLMFVQHMLAVTRQGGMVTTVMPHGVLFRAGEEGKIRTGLLNDDTIEAVIGLGPQLFYGTGIPACIVVLRPVGSKPADRRGKILFINADREYREGRAQNYLEPEHIEKIDSAYRSFEDVPSFARVVTRSELADNDDNLNIRRYVDTSPPPEPQNVRSHLHGGIPTTEVEAKKDLFINHGLDVHSLLIERDRDCMDFVNAVDSKWQLRDLIEADPGVVSAESSVIEAIGQWWESIEGRFDSLHSTMELVDLRKDLLRTFLYSLQSVTMLDRFAVNGVIASWWGTVQPDLKALATLGYGGLVDAWVSTVLDALEGDKSKADPLDQGVARVLLPEYFEALASLEEEVAALDLSIKSAVASEDDEADDLAEVLSEVELKELKRRLSASKKQLKADRALFARRLSAAGGALTPESSRELVLERFRSQIQAEGEKRMERNRREISLAFETWWDKYRVTLNTMQGERDDAELKLAGFLRELGYE